MLFYGQWDRGLDDKGRLNVPAEFTRALSKEVVLVLEWTATNLSLLVYPKKGKGWRKFPPCNIWLVQQDDQGRILLPEKLRSGFFGKRITWIGRGDHLEILFWLNPATGKEKRGH